MIKQTLRRLLFGRLILNLALLVGVAQTAVLHWAFFALPGRPGPGLAVWLCVAVVLVAGNALLVPPLRRARRRRGAAGLVARGYLQLAVCVLLLGMALLASALVSLPAWAALAVAGLPEAGAGVLRVVSGVVAGTTVLLLAWGYTIGQAVVDRTHVRIAFPGLSDALAGLRIVQLSDLHIGNGLEDGRLRRMVERTNALDPDVIVVTGDLFDWDRSHVADGARGLAGLQARYGVYAVLGNHDAAVGSDFVAEKLREHAPNLVLLRDEIARVPAPQPVYLAGVEDPGPDWAARGVELEGMRRVAEGRPADGPVVLLVHRPQAFPQAEKLGFPLMLAGHTHGGQLAIPWPGGQWNLASLVSPFTRGLYRRNGSTLYVNRGIGVGGPTLRIACPREITTIELIGDGS